MKLPTKINELYQKIRKGGLLTPREKKLLDQYEEQVGERERRTKPQRYMTHYNLPVIDEEEE